MVLQLRNATLSDIPAIVRLHSDAFQQSSPIDRIMHPRGLTPSVMKSSCADYEQNFEKSGTQYIVVVDSELPHEISIEGSIIAYARWYIWREERQIEVTHPALEGQRAEPSPDADTNIEFTSLFLGGLQQMKNEHMGGSPSVYLSLLATHPSHQGRGAASMLIRWGVELAEREGLPCWLIASPEAHHIYLRFRFHDVASYGIDVAPYLDAEKRVGPQIHENILMRR